jgi:PAS domain-containing protein
MAAPLDPNILLNTILEGMGQPFYAVDGEWRITLYNEDAARHFGRRQRCWVESCGMSSRTMSTPNAGGFFSMP